MHFGAMMNQLADAMPMVEFGRVAEGSGLDSVWIPDHVHRPIRAEERGKPIHDYASLQDQLCVLSAISSVTTTLKLGSAVTLVTQRDPILLAKEVATLDQLSGGRVILGVGAGHPDEPYLQSLRNHGADPATRFALLRERVLAMRAIWTQEEAEFHGQFVNFDPIWCWPKPVQQPHPPIVLGAGARTRKTWELTSGRLLDYCDGWMPSMSEPALFERIADLQRMARAAGRDPLSITVLWFSAAETQPIDDRLVEQYEAAGIERVIYHMPPGPTEQIAPRLREIGVLARRYG